MKGFSLHLRMNMPSPPPCWHRFPCFPLPLITNSALFSAPSDCPETPTVFGQLGYWWLMTREAFCIPKQHKLWLWTLETHSLSHAHASHSSDTLSLHADGACLKPAEQGPACQCSRMRVYQRHAPMYESVCVCVCSRFSPGALEINAGKFLLRSFSICW